uniref:Uncharacterized protein n=1 Tax=Wuchereria bancrofti TaxID=6293 RepID=A0A1I8EBT3_WUCBA
MAFCLLTHHFGKKQRYGKIGTLGYVYLTDCYEDTRATIVAHPVGIVFFAVRCVKRSSYPTRNYVKLATATVKPRTVVSHSTGKTETLSSS